MAFSLKEFLKCLSQIKEIGFPHLDIPIIHPWKNHLHVDQKKSPGDGQGNKINWIWV